MNKATVELKFTCGCGFVVAGYAQPGGANPNEALAVEAAQLHAETSGHKLHVEGQVTPSEKRMQVKRMHRQKKTAYKIPSIMEKNHESA